MTFSVLSTIQAYDLRDRSEFTVYKLQVIVKREGGAETTLELLKRYSQFDALHEAVRVDQCMSQS